MCGGQGVDRPLSMRLKGQTPPCADRHPVFLLSAAGLAPLPGAWPRLRHHAPGYRSGRPSRFLVTDMLAWMMFFVIFVLVIERFVLMRLERWVFRYRLKRGEDILRSEHDQRRHQPTDRPCGNAVLTFLRRGRVARWTSRLLLLLLWQLAGQLSARFPTPVETIEILVLEFQTRSTVASGASSTTSWSPTSWFR